MATTITTPPAKAWHQVTDQALNVPANGPAQMKRVYKLPISGCANIMNGIQLNAGISDVETWVRSSAGSLDTGISSTNFTPQSGYHWILQSFYLDEPEAGEYAILKCVFSQTDMDIDAISHLSSWTEEVSNLSSVTWQAYSVSPYIYCDEVDHNDLKWYKGDNLTSDTGHALRRHIEQAYTQNAQDSDNNWQLWRNQNTTYLLTDSEQAIMKKVAAGVNPVFHKPIVSIQKVLRTTDPHNVPQPNIKVDKISDPGITVKDWDGDFIFQGRSWSKTDERTYYTSTHDEVVIYTLSYVDTWEGAMEPDQDFYGLNAWKFHEGPDGQNNGN